jgi:hypothetical protein
MTLMSTCTVKRVAPGPAMVRSLSITNSPLVRVTVVTLGAKLIVSPGEAAMIACRKEPGPLSFPFVTVMVAACACIAVAQSSSTPITATPSRLIPLSNLASNLPGSYKIALRLVKRNPKERPFRRDAKTSTRDACATPSAPGQCAKNFAAGTQVKNPAPAAIRFARVTAAAAVPDEPVTPVRPMLARDELHQIDLDLFRIFVLCQTKPRNRQNLSAGDRFDVTARCKT